MFIYRDEYYNRGRSERPGEADLIIAKHRNGGARRRPADVPERVPALPRTATRSATERRGALPVRRSATAPASSSTRRRAPRAPCRCRAAADRQRRRARSLSAVIPQALPRTCRFDRAAGDATCPSRVVRVDPRATCADIDEQPRRGPRPVAASATSAPARRRSRCSSRKAALDAGRTVAIYSLPRLLAEIRATFDDDARTARTSRCSTASPSVDLLHIDDVGAEQIERRGCSSSSTRSSTRATRSERSIVDHDEPRARRARRADRRAHRLAAGGDVRRAIPLHGDGPPRRVRRALEPRLPSDMPGIVHRRRPVGRRGQGQGHRPARRAGRRRRALPGRQQRRPHDRPRRRDVEVPPDPVRDPLPRQAVRDRQRRRDRPEGADRRARRAARAAASTSAACSSRPTRT